MGMHGPRSGSELGGGTVKSGEGLALPACAMHALM